jgi:hypothetical protein
VPPDPNPCSRCKGSYTSHPVSETSVIMSSAAGDSGLSTQLHMLTGKLQRLKYMKQQDKAWEGTRQGQGEWEAGGRWPELHLEGWAPTGLVEGRGRASWEGWPRSSQNWLRQWRLWTK